MSALPLSKEVTPRGFRIHYLEWESSKAAPMVLLHGIGDNAHIWDRFSGEARAFFRIFALDQRGHGSSGWPVPPAYACGDYVADLEGFIDALGLTGVVLMGHSMGALHATRYASLHPRKVAALIHVDIEACPPEWNKKYLTGLYRELPRFYPTVEAYVDWMQVNSPHADRQLLREFALTALVPDGEKGLRCLYDRELLQHFDRYDLRPFLGEVACPALVVRGRESRVLRADVALEMSRAMHRGKFAEIPAAAHPVHTDNPPAFARTILSFLDDQGLL